MGRSRTKHGDIIVALAEGMRRCETYVEIGVGKGDTFNVVAPLARRAVGVDIVIPPQVLRASNVELHKMKSRQFASYWRDPIDLLFIDGNHKFSVAMADFMELAPFVRDHTGVIVLHDTYPLSREYAEQRKLRRDQCWRVAERIRSDPAYADYEIVTLPIERVGLSIIRRARTHMEWSVPADWPRPKEPTHNG